MGLTLSAKPGEFSPGDYVLVKSDIVSRHHRTPWFIKGKKGRVRAVSGPFFDPETRAHGGSGIPKRLLYQIEFKQTHIWGDAYSENRDDTLIIDIYEQWLEPASRNQDG